MTSKRHRAAVGHLTGSTAPRPLLTDKGLLATNRARQMGDTPTSPSHQRLSRVRSQCSGLFVNKQLATASEALATEVDVSPGTRRP